MSTNHDSPWWLLDDCGGLLTATVDELRNNDESRRVRLRILDDLFEGKTLYSATNRAAVGAVGRAGINSHMLNFARNALMFVHSKVATDIPTVRAAGHGADSSQRRRARLLTKFIAGASHELKLGKMAKAAALSMLKLGTGCTKVTERDGRIVYEPVSPRDILIDPDDGLTGSPRVLYHTPRVDRRALVARFPDCAEHIVNAPPVNDEVDRPMVPGLMSSRPSDAVRLIEAWVLPLGDEPGRHTCVINSYVVLDEEWTDPRHPIQMTNCFDPAEGPFGTGVLEQLDPAQFEIDDLMAHIGRSIRENNLKIVVDDGGQVPIEAITDPTVGTILRTANGSTPKWITPQAVAPQDIQWLKELISWLYQIAGMDEGAASSQRPAGLNSGRALQFYHDFQSLRYADLSSRIGDHVLGIVERTIDAARRLHSAEVDRDQDDEESTDRSGGWTVRYASNSETRQISWDEVDMDRDAFVIELEEASAFPDTLAGRMQQVEQDAAEGRVDPTVLAQLRLDPDLEARWDRTSAQADYTDWLVEKLSDPEEEMPEFLDELGAADIDSILDALRAELKRAIMATEEPAVIERLRDYIGKCVESTEEAARAQAAAQSQQPLAPQMPTAAVAGDPMGAGQMLG